MITYSELAARVGSNPRAVGQANGANPVAIVIPCHRVVGKDGSLVGYASGLDMKRALLKLERCILF
jgi:O-6-methylguanine DNA methyltransferase